MNFLTISNFLRGLIEHEGIERKIANESLVKLHNVDIDVTGRMIQRTGYEKWPDIDYTTAPFNNNIKYDINGNVIAPSFQSPIQAIYEYIDVANKKYIVIIANGYIYFEDSDDPQDWYCINIDEQLSRDNRIGVAYYLDKLFFNDIDKDIWVYNANYQDGEKLTVTRDVEVQIYFSGNTIRLLNKDYTERNETIIIAGGQPSGGNEIYQSMLYVVYPYRDNLKLGFSMKINGKYYVIDNGNKEGSSSNVCLLRFSEALLLEDFAIIQTDAKGKVYNFAYDGLGFIYMQTNDGELNKISILSLDNSILSYSTGSPDAVALVAPADISGNKIYTLAINVDKIYIYSQKVPEKEDWYQPVLIDKLEKIGRDINSDSEYGSFLWLYDNKIWGTSTPIDPKRREKGSDIFGRNANESNIVYFKWVVLTSLAFTNTTPAIPIPGGVGFYFAQQFTAMSDYNNNKLDPFLFLKEWLNPKMRIEVLSESLPIDRTHWNWDRDIGPLHPYHPGSPKAIEYDIKPDFSQYTLKLHSQFHYNGDGINDTIPTQIFLEDMTDDNNEKIKRIDTNCFYIKSNGEETIYNNQIMSSPTQSRYALLLEYQIKSGKIELASENTVSTLGDQTLERHRLFIPLGKLDSMDNVLPLIYNSGKLYFGTKGTVTKYFSLEIKTKNFEVLSDRKYYSIANDTIMHLNFDNGLYINNTEYKQIVINLFDFYSSINIARKSYTGIPTYIPINSNIMPLGVPKIPAIRIEPDTTHNFYNEYVFNYYVAYQFYSGEVTPLSRPSYDIEIHETHIKIIIDELNLLSADGTTRFKDEDVQYINVFRKEILSEITTEDKPIYFIGRLEKNEDGDWEAAGEPKIEQLTDRANIISTSNPIYDSFKKIQYKFKWILLHKNRMVYINNTTEANQNVIAYSDLDNAEAVPPTNIRGIQAGDGDFLTGAISSNDWLYLFKTRKTYAILGDVIDGQLVDIDMKIGCPYPYMACEFEGVIYFLNDFGIYKIINNKIGNVNQERIKNYFDKLRDDSINFEYIAANGFSHVDIDRREIMWFVPQKAVDNMRNPQNNLVIVYKVDFDHFKTRSYAKNIVAISHINDLYNKYKTIMSDYDGRFFEWSKSKNDDNNEIEWLIRTKQFNMNTGSFNKIFKLIKIAGKYLNFLRVTYWIDGERHRGNIIERPSKSGIGSSLIKVWKKNKADNISVEISGKSLNDKASEIDEILIGYNTINSVR